MLYVCCVVAPRPRRDGARPVLGCEILGRHVQRSQPRRRTYRQRKTCEAEDEEAQCRRHGVHYSAQCSTRRTVRCGVVRGSARRPLRRRSRRVPRRRAAMANVMRAKARKSQTKARRSRTYDAGALEAPPAPKRVSVGGARGARKCARQRRRASIASSASIGRPRSRLAAIGGRRRRRRGYE